MRVKRRKTARRNLRMFKLQYGISPPFKVLVDGNFLFAGARKKLLPMEEHISNALDNQPVVLLSCGAVLDELRKLQASQGSKADEEVQDAFRVALDAAGSAKMLKPWVKPGKLKAKAETGDGNDDDKHPAAAGEAKVEATAAGSTKSSSGSASTTAAAGASSSTRKALSPAADALLSLVGGNNRHRYVVATQDEQLKDRLRAIPGVPLLTVSRTMVAMEPPSEATTEHAQRTDERKLAPSKSDRRFLHDQFVERRQAGEAPEHASAKPMTKKRLRQLKRAAAEAAARSSIGGTGADAEPQAKKSRSRSRTQRKQKATATEES